jgi:hypothetical protein
MITKTSAEPTLGRSETSTSLVLDVVRGLNGHVQVADGSFDPGGQHFEDTSGLQLFRSRLRSRFFLATVGMRQ